MGSHVLLSPPTAASSAMMRRQTVVRIVRTRMRRRHHCSEEEQEDGRGRCPLTQRRSHNNLLPIRHARHGSFYMCRKNMRRKETDMQYIENPFLLTSYFTNARPEPGRFLISHLRHSYFDILVSVTSASLCQARPPQDSSLRVSRTEIMIQACCWMDRGIGDRVRQCAV